MPAQSTLKNCCVNTDDGLSFMNGDGSCTMCIGKKCSCKVLFLVICCKVCLTETLCMEVISLQSMDSLLWITV